MKKEYIKPVMESEMFVANEYCAPCYLVECDKGESMIIKPNHEPTFDPKNNTILPDPDSDDDGFGVINNQNVYFGEINDKKGENTPFGFGIAFYYHKVTVTKKGDSDGPNAS